MSQVLSIPPSLLRMSVMVVLMGAVFGMATTVAIEAMLVTDASTREDPVSQLTLTLLFAAVIVLIVGSSLSGLVAAIIAYRTARRASRQVPERRIRAGLRGAVAAAAVTRVIAAATFLLYPVASPLGLLFAWLVVEVIAFVLALGRSPSDALTQSLTSWPPRDRAAPNQGLDPG